MARLANPPETLPKDFISVKNTVEEFTVSKRWLQYLVAQKKIPAATYHHQHYIGWSLEVITPFLQHFKDRQKVEK